SPSIPHPLSHLIIDIRHKPVLRAIRPPAADHRHGPHEAWQKSNRPNPLETPTTILRSRLDMIWLFQMSRRQRRATLCGITTQMDSGPVARPGIASFGTAQEGLANITVIAAVHNRIAEPPPPSTCGADCGVGGAFIEIIVSAGYARASSRFLD